MKNLLKTLQNNSPARVQFLAVRVEALEALEKGYSRRAIYTALQEDGAFTHSYRQFCEYMAQAKEQQDACQQGPPQAPQEKPHPEQQNKPQAAHQVKPTPPPAPPVHHVPPQAVQVEEPEITFSYTPIGE